ncbi:MAG TPA: PAS domain S-box protein [Deltaproteobacteria bacterium]|nr:PAS domain S-box protein [Deltaproteobacteria bacterium]
MIYTYICLVIILLCILYIIRLSSKLHKAKEQDTKPSPLSDKTDDTFHIQDICFESSHEAIALFDDKGLLVISNRQFKKQFPYSSNSGKQTGIYDFFPEKLRSMLQEGLLRCQLDEKEVQQEFSIEKKHYIFTFSPVTTKNASTQIFLFCKELFSPPHPHRCISPDDVIWKTILKLTNLVALYSDWQSCFNQVLPDICEAVDADELFLLDNREPAGTPLFRSEEQNKACNHDWILSVPVWMNLLGKGKIIQNFADNFHPEEQIVLQQKGINTLLLIPLIVEKKLLGLIGLSRTGKSKLFTQQQINILLFISNILSMAISNQNDRSERDRLVTVVEQSSDCIIIINLSGNILYANPTCEDVTGFSPEEAVGKPIKRLYNPSSHKKLWQELKNNLSTGKSWNGQFTNYRKDNTRYEEEMFISPVYDKAGRVANQVIVKRDITEDKRLESIAEAANLMENIGFIFSSIRHELGNPINSIKVSLSVLQANLETYDTKEIARFVRRSLSDIGRVEYLLKTLRNFSIFERPDIQETNMRNLLDKLVQLTEKELAKQYVMLAIQHPKETLTGIVDPRAFLQVLLNLTTNAVAALTDNGNKKITISLIQKHNNQISFIFEDNGCGMEEETVRNLFRPFFTTKAEGTGLGLVIVKKMLSKMNCSITASSKKGEGTRMEIIIPSR